MADSSETSKIEMGQLRVLVEGSQAIRPVSDLEPQIETVETTADPVARPKVTRHANVIRRYTPLSVAPLNQPIADELECSTALHVNAAEFSVEEIVPPPPPAPPPMIEDVASALPAAPTTHWLRSLVVGATIGLVLVAIALTVLTLTA
jgi:hypothetical protein